MTLPASLSSQFGLIVGAIGLLFAVIGIAFVVTARIIRRRRAAFAADAATTSAEVVDNVWQDVSPASDVSLSAFPVLRYRLPDGTTIEQQSFEGASPPVARKGDTVDVLYDPANPTRVRIAKDGFAYRLMPGAFVAVGSTTALLGALMVVGAIVLLAA